MALAALKLEEPTLPISEQLNAEVGRAVVRMIAHCKKHKALADALAEGPVFDSTTSIVEQINTIFPKHLRTDPVVEDLINFITETAEKARQNNQTLRFTFFTQGKVPENEDKEGAHFVRVYTDRGSKSTDNYDQIRQALKMNGGGSSGGSGQQMIEELTAGLDSGFILHVNTAASQDTMGVSVDQVQSLGAFAQSTEAMAEAKEMMAQGELPPAAQNVIQQVTEIKTLQIALRTAEGPQIAAIAAAIAVKTEGLNAALPNIDLPPAIVKEIGRQIDVVKNDFSAGQLARVVDLISSSLPANQTDKPAAHQQIKDAVEQVRMTAKAENMTVKDMLSVVMNGSQNAPDSMTKAVIDVAKTLAKSETIQALDAALPAAIAQIVRHDIATPAMTNAAHTPIKIEAISNAIENVAERTGLHGLNAAVDKLESLPASHSSFAATLSIPIITSVAENAQAMTMVQTLPASIPVEAAQTFKSDMAVIQAMAETAVVQLREPANPAPAPTELQQNSPVVLLAEAVQVAPPVELPPTPGHGPDLNPPALTQLDPHVDVPPLVLPPNGGPGHGPVDYNPPQPPVPLPDNTPPFKDKFNDVGGGPRDVGPQPHTPPEPPIKYELIDPNTGPTERVPYAPPHTAPHIPSELPREQMYKAPEHKEIVPVLTGGGNGTPPYEPIKTEIKGNDPNPCQPPRCPCGVCGLQEIAAAKLQEKAASFDLDSLIADKEPARPRVSATPQ